jgi:hypothetical protein
MVQTMKSHLMNTSVATLFAFVLALTGCLVGDSDQDGRTGTDQKTDPGGSGGGGGSSAGGGGGSSGGGASTSGGSDDGGGGTNICHVNQNGHEIQCVNGACTCLTGGQQTSTCTAPDPATACSSPGNCCGF